MSPCVLHADLSSLCLSPSLYVCLSLSCAFSVFFLSCSLSLYVQYSASLCLGCPALCLLFPQSVLQMLSTVTSIPNLLISTSGACGNRQPSREASLASHSLGTLLLQLSQIGCLPLSSSCSGLPPLPAMPLVLMLLLVVKQSRT